MLVKGGPDVFVVFQHLQLISLLDIYNSIADRMILSEIATAHSLHMQIIFKWNWAIFYTAYVCVNMANIIGNTFRAFTENFSSTPSL